MSSVICYYVDISMVSVIGVNCELCHLLHVDILKVMIWLLDSFCMISV